MKSMCYRFEKNFDRFKFRKTKENLTMKKRNDEKIVVGILNFIRMEIFINTTDWHIGGSSVGKFQMIKSSLVSEKRENQNSKISLKFAVIFLARWNDWTFNSAFLWGSVRSKYIVGLITNHHLLFYLSKTCSINTISFLHDTIIDWHLFKSLIFSISTNDLSRKKFNVLTSKTILFQIVSRDLRLTNPTILNIYNPKIAYWHNILEKKNINRWNSIRIHLSFTHGQDTKDDLHQTCPNKFQEIFFSGPTDFCSQFLIDICFRNRWVSFEFDFHQPWSMTVKSEINILISSI